MIEIVFRPEAEADIREISDYTEAQWGRQQARRYVETINAAIKQLSIFPGQGTPIIGLTSNYRKLTSGSHRIIYSADNAKLVIVRILHERMDIDDRLD